MSCRAESRCEPAKNSFITRLASAAASLRAANRDRRLLLALDDRMLGDIGLERGDVIYGIRGKTAPNATPQPGGWQISALTIVIVMISLIVALVAPDGSKVDPVRITSCALFPQGMMGAGNKGMQRCAVPYSGCRRIPGAPKHVC